MDEEHLARVAACTVEAVHRRDHRHATAECCQPHAVEVVHLGRRAAMVCHDCDTESGFLPQREATALAHAHRGATGTGPGDRPGGAQRVAS